MTKEGEESALVAREVPSGDEKAKGANEVLSKINTLSIKDEKEKPKEKAIFRNALSPAAFFAQQSLRSSGKPTKPARNAATLTADLLNLPPVDQKAEKKVDSEERKKTIEPADFLSQQSIRSSELARKTKTTSKFGGNSACLTADLLNLPEVVEKKTEIVDVEKKNESEEVKEDDADKKSGEEGEDEDVPESILLGRGPVRASSRHSRTTPHHPYGGGRNSSSGAAHPAVNVGDYTSYSAYGRGYECGAAYWPSMGESSGESSPETSYSSCSSSFDSEESSSAESGYSSRSSSALTRSSPQSETPLQVLFYPRPESPEEESGNDLPENVSDFILAYSTMITSGENPIYKQQPSDPYSSAPSSPLSPSTQRSSLPRIVTDRPARQRLRVHIGQDKTEQAVLWICKCVQGCIVGTARDSAPIEKTGGESILFWQNQDGDTFLHICLLNFEVPKAYAIVEQQLKQDASYREGYLPPWDRRNRFGESPLFIAVRNRHVLLVDYLLELGADPNVESMREERETALMHAAVRGEKAIVKKLLRKPDCNLELANDEGMTALHLAVWHNGGFDQGTQQHLDTLEVVQLLLEKGADCTKRDSRGRTLYHMAVQKCDEKMLEQLARCISDQVAVDLANQVDNDGNKPFNILQRYMGKIDQELYQSCYFALLTCNANVE